MLIQQLHNLKARLQALSILVYANAIQDNTQQLLYNGLMEELVDVLELDRSYLTEIKAAALKTLTSIIHLDRAQNFPRYKLMLNSPWRKLCDKYYNLTSIPKSY